MVIPRIPDAPISRKKHERRYSLLPQPGCIDSRSNCLDHSYSNSANGSLPRGSPSVCERYQQCVRLLASHVQPDRYRAKLWQLDQSRDPTAHQQFVNGSGNNPKPDELGDHGHSYARADALSCTRAQFWRGRRCIHVSPTVDVWRVLNHGCTDSGIANL